MASASNSRCPQSKGELISETKLCVQAKLAPRCKDRAYDRSQAPDPRTALQKVIIAPEAAMADQFT